MKSAEKIASNINKWHETVWAVKTFPPNCSACCFRNWEVPCKKMTCQYLTETNDLIMVYWRCKLGIDSNTGIFGDIDGFFLQDLDAIKAACLEKIKLAVNEKLSSNEKA